MLTPAFIKTLRFRVTRIEESRWVDCSYSDCMSGGFTTPSKVVFRTVSDIRVSELPNSDAVQKGHKTAYGTFLATKRDAKRLLGVKELSIGLEANFTVRIAWRNGDRRKEGSFRCFSPVSR